MAQDAEIVSPGVTATVWTFNGTSAPAPTLRFAEGDHVTINFKNETPHMLTQFIFMVLMILKMMAAHRSLPGEEYTYEFVAG